jgi:hypothetical protein
MSDNGIYTSAEFTRELEKEGQGLKRSGVGAHHQNGIAERAIRTVTEQARTMLLHAATHWPEETSMDLWPMAMSYASYMWNHMPIQGVGLSPEEIFSRSKMMNSPLLNAKVWGCPVYVLDPKLQDGIKIPKWSPRSRRGQFVGFSRDHATSIGVIRNLRTQSLSPQFHVVYDNWFETVTSSSDTVEPPGWKDLVVKSRSRVTFDDDLPTPKLAEEWLSPEELAVQQQVDSCQRQQRELANGCIIVHCRVPTRTLRLVENVNQLKGVRKL